MRVELTKSDKISNSQLDQLGNRVRKDDLSGEDIRLLDQYRRSFTEGYEQVVEIIRNTLDLQPTGRPAKSTTSIRDKLKRESIRLSQMQDIAGCRIVVADTLTQDAVVAALIAHFPESKLFDRRKIPSHGYRAVHLIAYCANNPIEIQIRSVFQHMWAELSEKAADVVDPAVKYGGGPEPWRTDLIALSRIIAEREDIQTKVHELKAKLDQRPDTPADLVDALRSLEKDLDDANIGLQQLLQELNTDISK